MQPELCVLVSIGRHPVSGQPRRAEADARALALARSLTGPDRIRILHAGDPAADGLADYLGSGIGTLDVLPVPAERDIAPGLAAAIGEHAPDIVLAGMAAERGPGSGLLPYALAHTLDVSLVPGVATIEAGEGDERRVLQALPHGQRRALAVSGPMLATVDRAAAALPAYIYARALRGHIHRLAEPERMPVLDGPEPQPARHRPKRLGVVGGGSAAQRLAAAAGAQSGGGQQLAGVDAEQAAARILEYLHQQGVLRSLD